MDPSDIEKYLSYATSIIGVLSIVAAVTPTPIDNAVLVVLKQLINLGGFNFGGAENIEVPGDKSTVEQKKKRSETRKRRGKG